MVAKKTKKMRKIMDKWPTIWHFVVLDVNCNDMIEGEKCGRRYGH